MIKFEIGKEYLFQDVNKKPYISYCKVLSLSYIKFKVVKKYSSIEVLWYYKHLFDFVSVIKRHELTEEKIIELEKLGITI